MINELVDLYYCTVYVIILLNYEINYFDLRINFSMFILFIKIHKKQTNKQK